ncbi:MAG: FkbM family methyltransferase [Candidatus Electrothrix sp. AW5]|nr:FkbM family methyltransferase [Candidatus Electrothrix gigas]
MKKLSASLVSFIATQFPDFTGKVKLIRALGLICNGAYILGKYGVLMQADLNDNTNLWALLGWYDSVADEIKQLRKGDAFIDIGANAGVFSLMAGQRVGREGIVLAFEPQRPLFAKLVSNIQANKLTNIFCFNLAISDQTGMVEMSDVNAQHTGIASIQKISTQQIKNSAWAVNPLVDMKVIKKMLTDRIVTVKIDVEGYELYVLKGISGLLESKNVRKVIVEIDDENLKGFDTNITDIYIFMDQYDFFPTKIGSRDHHFDEVFVKKA